MRKPHSLVRLQIPLSALLLSFGLGAAHAATNVLVNPGFETGNANGWTPYGSHAVESTNSTYYNGGNPGGANVLTHSGVYVGKTWGAFSGSYNTDGYYQDVVAGPGSIWTAGGFALSHQQDFISGANAFCLEVLFMDANNTILEMHRSGSNNSGLLQQMDTTVTPSTWQSLDITNTMDITNDPSYMLVAGNVTTMTAPPGTSKARFQILFTQQAGYDGGSVYFDDLYLNKIAGSDPDISASPVSQKKVVGQSVTFSVSAAGATTLHYQWVKNGTNNLVNGGNVSGATSATLTLSSLTASDAGNYTVVVTDNAGTVTSSAATLTVVSAAQASNLLVNPGFETGADAPWIRFNGGGLATTNNNYYLIPDPVQVYDGLYVSQTYGVGNGSWNGIYQDVPASPGQAFKAEGWFLLAAQDPLTGQSEAWLELQFMNAAGNMIGLYRSDHINTNGFPSNTWVNLKATNIIAFWGDYSVAGQAQYPTAPAGTAKARYQVTFQAINGGGSIWYDDMSLFLRLPVTVTPSLNAGNLRLSFPTQLGVQYQVLYKNDLGDASWQQLGATVTGDGNVQTVTDSMSAGKRFYRVNTL